MAWTEYSIHLPLGDFTISLENDIVKSLTTGVSPTLPLLPPKHSVTIELSQFFKGSSRTLNVAIDPDGTPFQKKVWKELQNIPFGKTRTYGEIAKAIDNPNGSRAVGSACRANPILLIIPCHRVIAAQGIGGFSAGITQKEQLLSFENPPV